MQIHQNNVLKHIDHKIDCFKDPIPYLDLNDMMKMYMKTWRNTRMIFMFWKFWLKVN
jgi:hypothetical protein